MPFCEVSKYQSGRFFEGIRIFYETYGKGPTRILLIAGLACNHAFWAPQIEGLTGIAINQKGKHNAETENTVSQGENISWKNSIQICSFDNRGIGQSTIPSHKSYYTTSIMARDALALLEHLGWSKVHVVGHSMGAMIASKLACIAPSKLSSLALLSVTGGGLQCIPKVDRTIISLFFRFLKARTPEARAAVDLETHYTKEFLEAYVGKVKRRTILHQEYVRNSSANGMQRDEGFNGHANACWTHHMSSKEYETICSTGVSISVIHSRHDIIAQIGHARKIAKMMHPMANMVELDGGHLVTHERSDEVNQILMEHIKSTELKMQSREGSKLPNSETGYGQQIFECPNKAEKFNESFMSFFYSLHSFVAIILVLMYKLWDHVKSILTCLKSIKVEAEDSYPMDSQRVESVDTGSAKIFSISNSELKLSTRDD